jgi:hypothetical protein
VITAAPDFFGHLDGLAEVFPVQVGDPRVGMQRVAVAAQGADFQPMIVDHPLPFFEILLISEQIRWFAVRFTQLGDVTT